MFSCFIPYFVISKSIQKQRFSQLQICANKRRGFSSGIQMYRRVLSPVEAPLHRFIWGSPPPLPSRAVLRMKNRQILNEVNSEVTVLQALSFYQNCRWIQYSSVSFYTNCCRSSFSPRTIPEWNSLPLTLRCATSTSTPSFNIARIINTSHYCEQDC